MSDQSIGREAAPKVRPGEYPSIPPVPPAHPVSLCMISRGETNLHHCLHSAVARPDGENTGLVQEIIIVCDPADRPAVNGELEAFAFQDGALGIPVRVIERPWDDDFSRQRQAGFDAASHELVLWLDSDDVLVGAEKLRAVLRDLPADGTWQINLDYDYATDWRQVRERIVPRSKGHWADPQGDPLEVHELWMPPDRRPLKVICPPRDDVRVEHKRPDGDESGKAGRNRRLLEKHIARRLRERRRPDRRLISHYITQLLMDGEPAAAVRVGQQFVEDETDPWCRHRLLIQMAKAYDVLRDFEQMRTLATLALVEVPRSAVARLALIDACCKLRRWDEALHWYGETFEHDLALVFDPTGSQPSTGEAKPALAAAICVELKLPERALEYAIKAGDTELIANLTEIVSDCHCALAAGKMMDMKFREASSFSRDFAGRKQFALSLPKQIQNHPAIAKWLLPDIPVGTKSVVIYCGGEGLGMTETWGPDSLGRGIGGSEEAVIRVARELAAQGLHVEVYGPWPAPGLVDGVHYCYHAWWNHEREVDVFIAWRYEGFLGVAPRARRRILWLHDQVQPNSRFDLVDELWCLSKSHARLTRRQCPAAPPIWVTRNGVPPDLANVIGGPQAPSPSKEKVPGRVIWASSPDRGLDILLDMWPDVRAAVPNATLDVFYGFAASYLRAEATRPALTALRLKIEAQLVELAGAGVTYHGMVGSDRLNRGFAEAEVWAYPTHWPETSCITAMKAQALGCYPVTVPLTALAETVQWGRLLPLGGQHMTAEWNAADRLVYLKELIAALQTPFAERGWTPDLATRFGWDTVAAEWADRFRTEKWDGFFGSDEPADPVTGDAGSVAGEPAGLGPGDGGPGPGDSQPVGVGEAGPLAGGGEPVPAGAVESSRTDRADAGPRDSSSR